MFAQNPWKSKNVILVAHKKLQEVVVKNLQENNRNEEM